MGFRRPAFGLIVTVASLLLAACQGASTQPLAPAASTQAPPTTSSIQTPAPATATPAATPTLPPGPTAAPAATGTPEEPAINIDVPASAQVIQQTPTPQPAATVETGEPHSPSPLQPITVPRQPQSAVFYEQNGLTLEYYWPLDDLSNLLAYETEIFAYNEIGYAIQFVLP